MDLTLSYSVIFEIINFFRSMRKTLRYDVYDLSKLRQLSFDSTSYKTTRITEVTDLMQHFSH